MNGNDPRWSLQSGIVEADWHYENPAKSLRASIYFEAHSNGATFSWMLIIQGKIVAQGYADSFHDCTCAVDCAINHIYEQGD